MSYFKPGTGLAIDTMPILSGVENDIPANLLPANRCVSMFNRLAAIDSRNRPRPGITRQLAFGNVNPILAAAYYTAGQYLLTDGNNLWGYSTQTKVKTLLTASLPFLAGSNVPPLFFTAGGTGNSGNIMIMTQQGTVYAWNGSTLIAASMPVQSPSMDIPIWGTNRLITIMTGSNIVVFADIGQFPFNWGPLNNSTTVQVQVDQEGKDSITGLAIYQLLTLLVFKRGKIYQVGINPAGGTAVANFPIVPVSQVIGAAHHRTIKQLGNDVYFLSETGNGVYAINSLVGTSNIGVSNRKSARIQQDINNINWAAVSSGHCASATFQDLYLLFVPINGSTTPNAIYCYAPAIDEWQGIWTVNTAGGAADAWQAIADNPSGPLGSELLYSFANGDVGLQSRPLDGLLTDVAVGGALIPFSSSVLLRAFHWSQTLVPPSAAGEPYNIPPQPSFINLVEPYNVRFRFNQSTQPVQVDVITDQQTTTAFIPSLSTTTKKVHLPVNLPFNLDTEGDNYEPINIQGPCSACNEVQFQLTGIGDWRIQSADCTAFVSRPQDNL